MANLLKLRNTPWWARPLQQEPKDEGGRPLFQTFLLGGDEPAHGGKPGVRTAEVGPAWGRRACSGSLSHGEDARCVMRPWTHCSGEREHAGTGTQAVRTEARTAGSGPGLCRGCAGGCTAQGSLSRKTPRSGWQHAISLLSPDVHSTPSPCQALLQVVGIPQS